MRLTLLLFVSLMNLNALSAQERHPILSHLRVFEVNGSVHIDCTIKAGFTCNGINYFRSANGVDYEKIGDVSGICGSPDFEVRYQFIDGDPPKNQKLFYAVDLGGFGLTEAISLEIVDTDALGYQIRPNPSNGAFTLFFKNPLGQPHSISIYSISGQLTWQGFTYDRSLPVNLDVNASGIYYFVVENQRNGATLAGSISIQK